MRPMKRTLGAAALAAVLMPVAAGARDTALCDRLAAEARKLPASAWNGSDPWAATGKTPALVLEQDSAKPSPLEAQLASLPWVKDAIGADGGWAVFTQRLPGTDVYMASTVEGTLHCQTSVFIDAKPGAAPKSLSEPIETDEGDVCWTISGDFGRVFGKPAYIVHGSLNDHTDDEDIRIVPWTGHGWGKMCKVSLRFSKTFTLAHTFCGDRDVCRAGEAIAVDVATAYNKVRERESNPDLSFRFGPPPTTAALAAVERAKTKLPADTSTSEFPTFGEKEGGDPLTFSYNGFAYFPVLLNGKYYVGAIGLDGVGWRESGRALFAVYSENQGNLTPLAGYAVDLSNGGLISARVENPNGPAN